MKLRKLKKFVQEKHGWWDTVKHKSCRDFPSGFNVEYWISTKTPDKKYVFRPSYVSTGGRVAWRDAIWWR